MIERRGATKLRLVSPLLFFDWDFEVMGKKLSWVIVLDRIELLFASNQAVRAGLGWQIGGSSIEICHRFILAIHNILPLLLGVAA